MQNNDKPNTQPELPSAAAKKPRLAPLRAWWNTAWDEGGALYAHWEDIRRARHAGWHGMAHWIKALLGLTGACAVIILLDTTADIVSAVARHLTDAAPTPATSSGFWAVVDNPVRTFIAQHTGGKPRRHRPRRLRRLAGGRSVRTGRRLLLQHRSPHHLHDLGLRIRCHDLVRDPG